MDKTGSLLARVEVEVLAHSDAALSFFVVGSEILRVILVPWGNLCACQSNTAKGKISKFRKFRNRMTILKRSREGLVEKSQFETYPNDVTKGL